MVTSKQLKRLATNPTDLIRFQTTGRLPEGVRPQSPLIDLLVAIGARDLINLHGLTIDQRLGYLGSRRFHTAAQALTWIRPSEEVFGAFPADSWRIKAFQGPLYIEDLVECCATVPDGFLERHPRLRKPANRGRSGLTSP